MKNSDDQILLFLQDDQFIRWIHSPSEELIAYWEKWMEEHPDDVPALFSARQIARDLAYLETPVGARDLSGAIWTDIQKKIGEGETPLYAEPLRVDGSRLEGQTAIIVEMRHTKPGSIPRKTNTRYWMAASLLGLLIMSAGVYYYRGRASGPSPLPASGEKAVSANLDRINNTARSKVLYLVDGSKVTLPPGSGIHHAAFLSPDKREIYLDGNAFFEVARDARRPFTVYTKDLVVKVLGTSFNVTTNKDNGDVTIQVQTGKVAVSKKPGQQANGQKAVQRQLILESNQVALFKAHTRDLIQSVPDTHDLAADPNRPVAVNPFSFEETPVTKVFKMLEDAYSIRLNYDEKTFSGCVITTSLADETLDEKLRIVCEAIGARYRIENNGVFIEGRPCKE